MNSEKYKFSDFTLDNYRKLIRLAKSSYEFSDFTKDDYSSKCIIWRHDVDASPFLVRDVAKINHDESIVSTIFYNIHSEFYNLLERSVADTVFEVKSLGQNIGLHFDASYYNIKNERQMIDALKAEKDILELFFKCPINVFSFHRTCPVVMGFDDLKYAGMVNAYSTRFKNDFTYCSDSGGYWRYNRLEDVLTQSSDKPFHVLTHPEFWSESISSPKERVQRCIDDRALRTSVWYRENLEKIGKADIDW